MGTIYTLWASMKGEEPSPWMIAAEDEYSWEGDPERCERVFADARASAVKNGWDVREVEVRVPDNAVIKAFSAVRIDADV